MYREGFERRFKIQRFQGGRGSMSQSQVDGLLPVSHTCFFSLELPAYSSKEVLKTKLLYAMRNCPAIDGDGAGADSRLLGFDEA